MPRRALLLLASAACASSDPSQATAITEPVWHAETDLARVEGELGAAAARYLEQEALGLSGEEGFELLSVRSGPDGLRHVRLQEMHRGVPVLGSEIAVHADDTTFLGYGGTVTRHLEGFEVAAAIAGDRAVELARAHAGTATDGTATRRLAIRPRPGGGADLVWQVEVRSKGRWFVLIDAVGGAVLRAYDGLATAQASGPGGNPRSARAWNQELDVEEDGGEYAMDTERQVTLDLKHQTGNGKVVRGPLDPIGDPAINDAHGFTEVTLDMLRDWLQEDSIDGAGFKLVSRVHYDHDFANAYWDGDVMTYGDGGDTFYPMSGALDIVAHEINHGFTEKHSNLTYQGMSGGLNESFSDIAGTMAEFFHQGAAADFDIGEDIVREGRALRTMCDPPAIGGSIDHIDDFDGGNSDDPGTDVHYSSGLGNKAFCLAVARYVAASDGITTAGAVRAVGRAWFAANAGYWTSESDFAAGCIGAVDGARGLGFEDEQVAAIQHSWADVGVYCGSGQGMTCQVDGVCDVEAGETCFGCASDCGSCNEACGPFKKAKCALGIGDCSRCGGGCGDGWCDGEEDDANCGQDCGCQAPGDSCASVAPYGCWCDRACDVSGDCCVDIDVCR
jgi:vibriolysin